MLCVEGACTRAHSSFHRDGAAGLFAQDWAREIKAVGEFGEA
jgi:hypothetical protein